jgi:hypothetical protein
MKPFDIVYQVKEKSPNVYISLPDSTNARRNSSLIQHETIYPKVDRQFQFRPF